MTSTVDTPEVLAVATLRLWVPGRPAPQGSKKRGEHGQMREASAYLPAWRAAIKKAVYTRYLEMGIPPAQTLAKGWALIRGPIRVTITWAVDWRPDTEPDGDKLERATWDGLTQSRVWEDDARVVKWSGEKVSAGELGMGAAIVVRAATP